MSIPLENKSNYYNIYAIVLQVIRSLRLTKRYLFIIIVLSRFRRELSILISQAGTGKCLSGKPVLLFYFSLSVHFRSEYTDSDGLG